jgi:hypothetical protein
VWMRLVRSPWATVAPGPPPAGSAGDRAGDHPGRADAQHQGGQGQHQHHQRACSRGAGGRSGPRRA